MILENVIRGIGGILMFGGFGTMFLVNYLRFQKLIYKLENMGGEAVGEIISIQDTIFIRYPRKLITVEFIADGAPILAPEFMVDRYTMLFVGQQVFVQFYKYNPRECLIKENPDTNWCLNDHSLLNGTMGLIAAAVCYFLALMSIVVIMS